jgi:hypothetical protein
VVFLWDKMMIESTEYHEFHGRSYEVTKYEPESEIELEDFDCRETEMDKLEERKFAITNNLAIAYNSCQSAKFHVSCLGNPNDKIPEEQRIEIIKRSIQVAINMIQSLKGLLDV